MNGLVTITVTNWNKYNGRTDQKSHTWFRCDNAMATDPKLYGLSAAQKFAWIVLLSQCSVHGNETVTLHPGHLAHLAGVAIEDVNNLLAHMQNHDAITCEPAQIRTNPAGSVPDPAGSVRYERTNERTNVRTERESASATASPSPLPRLIELWNEHRGRLAEVKKTNQSRNRRIEQRWREHTEAEWVEIIQQAARSDFLSGKNDRNWRATFDWMLQPDSALRVLDGKYDNTDVKLSAENVSDADWEKIFGEKRA